MIRFENAKYLPVIQWVWRGFFIFIILAALFVWAISIDLWGLFGAMPSLKALENPKSEQASEVYSADGKLMGKYFLVDRLPLAYEEISPYVINALIATEDIRFENHSGVDAKALVRVVFGLGGAGGGSTLTQQLAKNLFNTRGSENRGAFYRVPLLGIGITKIKEWITAIRLERNYTKKEIITMYLNECEFGHNAYGIQAAAKIYFSKDASDLDINEAAMLVGMLQAPSRYDPVSEDPKKQSACFTRRNVVLHQMKTYGYLKPEDYDLYKTKPVATRYQPQDNSTGIAPHFRAEAFKWLIDWAKKQGYAKDDAEAKEFLYTSGLKIYTTIDTRTQKHAEESIAKHMAERQRTFFSRWKGRDPWVDDYGRVIPDYIERNARKSYTYLKLKEMYGNNEAKIFNEMNKPHSMKVFSWETAKHEKDTVMSSMDSIRYYKHFLNTSFMSVEPKTGHIKAWVGSIGYKYFQYDNVKQGRKQPGSSFKPIVYAAAIDLGYTPCHQMVDKPVIFPGWIPRNSYGSFTYASMTLRQAIGQSVNSIAAGITKEIGVPAVKRYAKELGIETELPDVASISLGSYAISLYELLGAYCVFANRGYYIKPMLVTKITDKNGKVLEEISPEIREVMSEENAYLMLHMLMAGTERGGTSAALRNFSGLFDKQNQIGGKTGTTQNHADGWYVGVTQELISGLWVGGDDKAIRFLSIIDGQGAVLAMPAWGYYMQKVYNDPNLPYQRKPFERPQQLSKELDCQKLFSNIETVDGNQRRRRRAQ